MAVKPAELKQTKWHSNQYVRLSRLQ